MTKERMTKDESLKLALEALEEPLSPTKRMKAITAIKEVLAQHDSVQAKPEPEQEPFCYHDGSDIVGKEFADHSDVFPLYTTPPQRTWVGLTKDEIREVLNKFENDNGHVQVGLSFARAIEAKLKEKNT